MDTSQTKSVAVRVGIAAEKAQTLMRSEVNVRNQGLPVSIAAGVS